MEIGLAKPGPLIGDIRSESSSKNKKTR